MKAVLCPVCNGKGEVIPNWDCWDGKTLVKCHGCNGRGWVEVKEDEKISLFKWTYPNENIHCVDKCPACGGDRSLPGLTGCPVGNHYGSYCLPE